MAGAHHAREVRMAREGTRYSGFVLFREKSLNDKVSLPE
jgi:hypothetical protein